jgi:hypothetical protein
MRIVLAGAALAAVVLALAALVGGVLTGGHSAAQGVVTIGVDADPTGNEPTSLGPIDSCSSVSIGDTFQVDVFIADVTGVLARLTLKAIGPGVSPLSLSPIDINKDGSIDLGPFLKNVEAEFISDFDGDGFFDGPIANAEIVVGGACPSGTPLPSPTSIPTPVPTASSSPEPTAAPTGTPTATAAASPTMPASPTVNTPVASPTPGAPGENGETSSGGGPPWVLIACAAGAVAAVLLAGAALLAIRGRRGR